MPDPSIRGNLSDRFLARPKEEMKKIKPVYGFAAFNPRAGGGINPYWVRAEAKAVRANSGGRPWSEIRKDGWRVVKVKIVAVGKPR
tara:strand:- start:3966 stop:4223 length:258 start_codon:yes stop_codon:yes gene_type:complete